MTVQVIGSSPRVRIFDPIVQFGHPPNFPTEVERIVDDDREIIHQPRGSAASSKGGNSQKTTFEIRPDCVGPLVLARMFSSTEEALRRRISALFRSGSGVPRSLPRKRNSFSYGCRVDQKHLPERSNTVAA